VPPFVKGNVKGNTAPIESPSEPAARPAHPFGAFSNTMATPEPIPAASESAVLTVYNEPGAIELAQDKVVDVVERFGYPKASLFAIKLSLHEAVSNAFRHGHENLPKDLPITLSYKITPTQIELAVEDQGPGFDPFSIPDPTLEENIEKGSGRGLLLINAYMSRAQYNPKGNRLEMTYRRPG
jgi:serine/threonine-protein kinase RsbW